MNSISQNLKDHYRKTFLKHGASSEGVDWGPDPSKALIRNSKMLEVLRPVGQKEKRPSLLDVGCGYGALAELIKLRNTNVDYYGIEIVPEMVKFAENKHPDAQFFQGDFLEFSSRKFDYVVCNGVLTQKLLASNTEMKRYSRSIIKRMFDICNEAIVFNMMSTHVNYQSENLYYQNPAEMLTWCISELSPRVKLDCNYELWFEYSLFVYKERNSK